MLSQDHRTSPPINGERLPSSVIDGVEITVEAFIGEAHMTVAALQALTQDAIVALDASIAQPVELRLNRMTIARGELVVAGDAFGVRITDLLA